jgi:tRNA-specific 2-thiouridylase
LANTGDKVLVAMSGGVDSTVAAAMLQDDGYDVTGVFLCLRQESETTERTGACCSPQDAEDARQICGALDIELISMPVMEAFEPIIQDFVNEYTRGRTPNPCVHCNTLIKFGRLFDMAESLGAAYVATGHHARIVGAGDERYIARAMDRAKDQSYALFGIQRNRLPRILLPIGELEDKQRVRDIARRLGLSVHDKPDSQEVCFVPDDDYVSLLRTRAPEGLTAGDIVTTDGQVVGHHDGYAAYTIGQRRGLGVAAGEPMYVTSIKPQTATVVIGPKQAVMGRRLAASAANWHVDPAEDFRATVQIRYNHRGAEATVRVTGPDTFEVEFDEPVSAITPGQAAVIYDEDRLMGGGWIDSSDE